MKGLHIYWARRDFRLGDNPALTAAVKAAREGGEFLPIFILDSGILNKTHVGLPRKHGLAEVLARFAKNFERFLILDSKNSSLKDIFTYFKSKSDSVIIYANEDVEPYSRIRDTEVAKHVQLKLYRDTLTVDKQTKTGTGKIYSVFTPFKKNVWRSFVDASVLNAPNLSDVSYSSLTPSQTIHHTFKDSLAGDLKQHMGTTWKIKVQSSAFDLSQWCNEPSFEGWPLTEQEAVDHAEAYAIDFLNQYADSRNALGEQGTSRLSMALKWGLISARQLKDIALKHNSEETAQVYISELIWREFYKYILFHNPHVLDQEYQEKYRIIRWETDDTAIQHFGKWMKGETGYQIVDAAMNQLNQTGWMHNRARMIVGSFLTKHLGIDWRWGQDYFRATLLDLDEASNNGGWQWSASVGADPKPIRIFNPYIQEEKFDPDGVYRKTWLPDGYNIQPIVDHPEARDRAKARYKNI